MEVRPLILAAAALVVRLPAAAAFVYNKVYLDDPSVCNGTIHLHDGLPAVLVLLSPGDLTRPLTCSVQIEIANSPIAGGLSAVVQELSVGKFDDPSNCTSFLKVTTFGHSHRYTEHLCGEWQSSLHNLEVRKSLFGACDPSVDHKYGCTVREINLQAHIPRSAVSLQPKFEVVVTAYYNRELFMGCGAGRFLCMDRDSRKQAERCISQRLVCDGYPNCGFVTNLDEYTSTCNQRTGTITESDHFFATWAGFAVIVLLLVVAVSYFIRSVRWTTAREPADLHGRAARQPPPPRPGVPEPPPYEALYPQGPPSSFLEKKREQRGAEEAAPPPAPLRQTRREPAPPPQRHVLHGSARGGSGAAVTHIYVEPEEESPEEPPPYTERPALRHSVLLAEAVP